MSRTVTPSRLPALQHHQASGQARVRLNGRDHYLGAFGSPEATERYNVLVGEWMARGRASNGTERATVQHHRGLELQAQAAAALAKPDRSVNEVLLAFHDASVRRYSGRRTFDRCMSRVKAAIKTVRECYGLTPAATFGPKALMTVRERWIGAGLSRKTVNDNVKVVKACFRWAVREELVPPAVHHGLSAVDGLRAGESTAPEARKVKPVPDADVDAVLPYLRGAVRTMVEVQRLSGMRAGEVAIMRTRDLDVTGELWVYRPQFHKTEHHGHEREVYLGPQVQELLRPMLRTVVDDYVFRPVEAIDSLRADRAGKRKTPLKWGNRAGTNRKLKPKRIPHERYSVDSYRRAIERACDLADRDARKQARQPVCEQCSGRGRIQRKPCKACGASGYIGDRLIQRWSSHRLRHSFATRVRKAYGIEAARVMLGHQHVGVTEVYAERDAAVARTVAAKIG